MRRSSASSLIRRSSPPSPVHNRSDHGATLLPEESGRQIKGPRGGGEWPEHTSARASFTRAFVFYPGKEWEWGRVLTFNIFESPLGDPLAVSRARMSVIYSPCPCGGIDEGSPNAPLPYSAASSLPYPWILRSRKEILGVKSLLVSQYGVLHSLEKLSQPCIPVVDGEWILRSSMERCTLSTSIRRSPGLSLGQ